MIKNKLKIINIMLSSVNSKIAFHSHESSAEREQNSFTCKEDFERMRQLTATCDAVFIGARSIETEKGAFRVADIVNTHKEPEWIIFTESGNIPFHSPFWQQEGIPKSIFFISSLNFQEEAVFKIEEQDFGFGKINCYLGNINGLIQFLTQKKFKKAALLGGGKLNTAFWENNLINEFYLTISPFIIGGEDLPSILNSQKDLKQKLILQNCSSNNGFVFLDYFVG